MMKSLSIWVCLSLFLPQEEPTRQVRELIGKLHAKFNSDREEALRALIELGAAAVEALEALAEDPEPDVRARAARAIEEIQFNAKVTPNLRRRRPGIELRLRKAQGPVWTKEFLDVSRREGGLPVDRRLKREDVEPLALPALRGASTAEEEAEVCKRVAAWGFRSVSPEIQCRFEDARAEVREAAVRAAGKIRDSGAIAGLVERLADEREMVAQGAADSLGELRARKALPGILALLLHPRAETRRSALVALSQIGLADAAPNIRKRLEDEDPHVRQSAVWALVALESKDSAPKLVPLLRDRDPFVRGIAAEALGRLEAKESTPDLIALLEDGQGDVMGHAAGALARMGAREAIPALRQAIGRTGTSWSRGAVLDALGALGAREAVPEMRALLRNPGAESSAALALSILEAREAIPDILARLREDPCHHPEMLYAALYRMRPREEIQDLRDLLKHKSPRIRALAAGLLGEVRAGTAVPELIELLGDREPEVRCAAAGALGAAGGAAQVARLSKLLKDADPRVRRSVLRAWDGLESDSERSEVLAGLKDPDREVRVAAAEWLCHRGRSEGAAVVFEEAPFFHALNAVRNPETWRRLNSLQRPVEMEASPREIVSQLAALAGLRFEAPDQEEWPRLPAYHFKNPNGDRNVLETLESVLDARFVPYVMILDDKILRLVTSDAGMEFWGTWLDRLEKK